MQWYFIDGHGEDDGFRLQLSVSPQLQPALISFTPAKYPKHVLILGRTGPFRTLGCHSLRIMRMPLVATSTGTSADEVAAGYEVYVDLSPGTVAPGQLFLQESPSIASQKS